MDRIRFQNLTLRIRATRDAIEISRTGVSPVPATTRSSCSFPRAGGRQRSCAKTARVLREARLRKRESDGALRLNWGEAPAVRLVKSKVAPVKTAAEREAFFRAQPVVGRTSPSAPGVQHQHAPGDRTA